MREKIIILKVRIARLKVIIFKDRQFIIIFCNQKVFFSVHKKYRKSNGINEIQIIIINIIKSKRIELINTSSVIPVEYITYILGIKIQAGLKQD